MESEAKRIAAGVWAVVKGYDPFDQCSKAAVKTAAAVVSAVVALLWLDFGDPYLSALGVVLASFPFERSGAFGRTCRRCAGAGFGCLAEYLVLGLLIQQHELFSLSLFAFVALCFYLKGSPRFQDYASPAAFCFTIVAFSTVARGQDGFEAAFSCGSGFVIGALSAHLFNIVLFPGDALASLRTARGAALRSLAPLLAAVYRGYAGGEAAPEPVAKLKLAWAAALNSLDAQALATREDGGAAVEAADRAVLQSRRLRQSAADLLCFWTLYSEDKGAYRFQTHFHEDFAALAASLERILAAAPETSGPAAAASQEFIAAWRVFAANYQATTARLAHHDYPPQDVLLLNEAARCLAALFRDLGGKLADVPVAAVREEPGPSRPVDLGRDDTLVVETFPGRELTLSLPSLELGLKTGLCVFINFWLFFLLELQPQEAPTFALSVTSIFQSDTMATYRKGLLRLAGCLAGVAVATLLLGFQTPSATVYFLLVLTVLYAGGYLANSGPAVGYLGMQGCISFLNVALGSAPVTSMNGCFERPLYVFMGVGMAFLINYVLFPKDVRHDLDAKLRLAWTQFAALFLELLGYVEGKAGRLSATLSPAPFESTVNAIKTQDARWREDSYAADQWIFQAGLLVGEVNSLFQAAPGSLALAERIRPGFWGRALAAATAVAEAGAAGDRSAMAEACGRFVAELEALTAAGRATGLLTGRTLADKQAFAHLVITLTRLGRRFQIMPELEAAIDAFEPPAKALGV